MVTVLYGVEEEYLDMHALVGQCAGEPSLRWTRANNAHRYLLDNVTNLLCLHVETPEPLPPMPTHLEQQVHGMYRLR